MLVPDRLRELWDGVDRGETTTEAVMEEQERLLGEYRAEWTRALLEGTETDLRAGLLRELALYSHAEPEEMERRCTAALATLRDEWQRDVDPEQRGDADATKLWAEAQDVVQEEKRRVFGAPEVAA